MASDKSFGFEVFLLESEEDVHVVHGDNQKTNNVVCNMIE